MKKKLLVISAHPDDEIRDVEQVWQIFSEKVMKLEL